MAEYSFRPWKFAANALAVIVERIDIDSVEVVSEDVYSRETNHIGLVGRSVLKRLTIDCIISDQGQEIGETVPERPWATVLKVIAKVSIPDTRFRQAYECLPRDDGRWSASISLPADVLHGRVEVTPWAVRTSDGAEGNGFAHRKHDHLADGTPLRIDFDESPILPGHGFDGEWIDFGAPESLSSLRAVADIGWLLDLSNPNKPKLLLNSGIEGFRQLLELPARTGQRARLRDVATHSVIQPVLVLLATEAIQRLAAAEEGEVEGWPKAIVSSLSRRSPELTPDLQEARWLADWKGGDRGAVLRGLEVAIQKHIAFASGVRDLAKSFQSTLSSQ